MNIQELTDKVKAHAITDNYIERIEKHKDSREKACDARYHAHELELALEVFYWTGDSFQYREAISHFESLVSEMA